MPKFVIERELPGVGGMSAAELESISAKSNAVIDELGPGLQWVHSYVTANALVCVYNAADESVIQEHARRGGFPCTRIRRIGAVIDPVTGGL